MANLSQFKRLIEEVFTVPYTPLYIYWKRSPEQKTMQKIHRFASSKFWGQRPAWQGFFLKTLFFSTWFFRAFFLSQKFMRKFGQGVLKKTGKSLWKQFIEQVGLALKDSLDPKMYYQYGFYQKDNPFLVGDYLYQPEASALFSYLNKYQHESIQNKELFTSICIEQGLPVVPIFATSYDNELIGSIPKDNIFIKTASGARGEGAMQWFYLENDCYQNAKSDVLSRDELSVIIAKRSRKETYLIQPLIANHPKIPQLSHGALSTVRIVTGIYPDGKVKCIVATYKMSLGKAITNTHGLNSPVNLETGELGRAYTYRPLCAGYDQYPHTGADITGQFLPNWIDVLQVAIKAHQVFSDYVFLGWDIALTPNGVFLLEGNTGWDVVTVQKPQGVPLGHTAFVDICMAYI